MVVDDSTIIRGFIRRMLESDPEFKVVATAVNGEMAISTVARTDVDVVILDIEMPVMDGLTALPLILKA
ncbi:MAG: response regulator, partial [Acidobacteria bacterium]|nr:response regulator [Acidobacteriota bacterium]